MGLQSGVSPTSRVADELRSAGRQAAERLRRPTGGAEAAEARSGSTRRAAHAMYSRHTRRASCRIPRDGMTQVWRRDASHRHHSIVGARFMAPAGREGGVAAP